MRAYKWWRKGEAKGKGEKERYTHLNAEFQRIARRDKKAFLSNQCKEIEASNRPPNGDLSPGDFWAFFWTFKKSQLAQTAWVQMLSPLLTSCVTSGK